MVQKLTKLGFLDYKRYGIISLTANGKEIGSYLLKRHQIIELFLKNFSDKENLLLETELIEHVITVSTLQRFFDFNRFMAQNPEILHKFEQFSPPVC
jgi:Mn-dependent DtxR family transcriptional regulator